MRTLYGGAVDQLPQQMKLNLPAMVAGADTLGIDFGVSLGAGGSIIFWDATQDGGQFLTAGIYEIKAEITDQFGHVISMTREFQVLTTAGASKLTIYNSAGEEVYWQGLNAGNGVVTSLDLDSSVLVLGGSGSTAPIKGTLHTGLGNMPWTWNGLNSQGLAVSPGTYMIHVYSGSGTKLNMVSVKQVMVILASDGGIASLNPHVVPNPVDGNWLGAGKLLTVQFDASSGTLRGKIYNLAGELVAQSAAAAMAGKIEFKPSHSASGIYLVALDYVDSNGRASRATLKLVIVR